jgi:serine/threonine protein kinase
MHVDFNQEERILVYKYFRHTLLALITEYPDFPATEIKKILRCTGEAVKEFHDKGWIHLDVKPDNILVNWTCDEQGNQVVTDVVLGDFDIAFKPEGGEPLQTSYAIGNVMWRSPEGQTARGVTKASDVFSFGLVCIYALGAGNLLVLKDYQALVKNGVMPEQEILHRHLLYFGPLPEGLLKQIKDESWCDALKKFSEMAEAIVNDDPGVRFEQWGEDVAPNLTSGAKSMISRMTNLDPAARTTIDEVLEHQWW